MQPTLSMTCYSDLLCVWAYIAQARIDEVKLHFPQQVSIDYRFCSVFGDSAHKINNAWGSRGGYEGFAAHVQEAAAHFDHITLHPDLWSQIRPHSSTPAHLLLKAVQDFDADCCETVLVALRRAFFERGLDIGSREVLEWVLNEVNMPVAEVYRRIDDGQAHAQLEADNRDKETLMVQGSPTFLLNDGRQKLYGNVGYGVIEANIRELIRSPMAGSASWC